MSITQAYIIIRIINTAVQCAAIIYTHLQSYNYYLNYLYLQSHLTDLHTD